jgi:hypothetical protein
MPGRARRLPILAEQIYYTSTPGAILTRARYQVATAMQGAAAATTAYRLFVWRGRLQALMYRRHEVRSQHCCREVR